MLEIYYDTYRISDQPNPLIELVLDIDMLVEECAERAYYYTSLDFTNPTQRNWCIAIERYYETESSPFIKTYYGSAVEEMVNQRLILYQMRRRYRYKIELQVTHGNTRPDIVLVDSFENNCEVAWLDITSERSAGHIFSKSGRGWYTTNFVAELLYPACDLTKIRETDENGIESCSKAMHIAKQISKRNNILLEYLLSKMTVALGVFDSMDTKNRSTLLTVIEYVFNYPLPSNHKHTTIKSLLLKYLWSNEEVNYSSEEYNEFVRRILKMYNSDHQNVALATSYLSDSYDRNTALQHLYNPFSIWK